MSMVAEKIINIVKGLHCKEDQIAMIDRELETEKKDAFNKGYIECATLIDGQYPNLESIKLLCQEIKERTKEKNCDNCGKKSIDCDIQNSAPCWTPNK